jgi:hypothetical protein
MHVKTPSAESQLVVLNSASLPSALFFASRNRWNASIVGSDATPRESMAIGPRTSLWVGRGIAADLELNCVHRAYRHASIFREKPVLHAAQVIIPSIGGLSLSSVEIYLMLFFTVKKIRNASEYRA